MRYRARVAYDGSRYQGFQRQRASVPSVQAAIETAIERVLGAPTPLIAAGRTDSGVHAIGQVIAFDAQWPHSVAKLQAAINAHLPPDIALQEIRPQAGFHPRYDALSRVYDYLVINAEHRQPLWAARAWQVRGATDIAAMQQAAALLVGEHDFASFGRPPKGENTVRRVFASVWRQQERPFGQLLIYRVEATAFLHHMVRRMVGMMLAVGKGQWTLGAFEAAFRQRHLASAKHIAPPQGLYLVGVRYPNENDDMPAIEAWLG